MGWYCYLQDQMEFPFQAKCIETDVVSPLRKGETVEVLDMAPADSCDHNMLVCIRWKNRKMAVPLSQLSPIGVSAGTVEAAADWHYWVAQGYLF